MRAAGPTARTAHAFAHFIKADCYTTVSGFIFLGRCNPANPFIARERCDIRPYILCHRIRIDCFAKIRRHFMYHTSGDFFFGHTVTSNFLHFFKHFALFVLEHNAKAKANMVLECGKSCKNTMICVEWHAPAYSFFYNWQCKNQRLLLYTLSFLFSSLLMLIFSYL